MISESRLLELLRCPICAGDLCEDGPYLACAGCGHRFPLVENIAVFLTKDDLSGFLSEPWGSELQKEGYGRFVSADDKPEDLRSILQKAKKKAEGRPLSDAVSEDDGLSEEARRAVDASRERVVELSRARCAKTILDWPTGPGFCLTHLLENVGPETLVVALDVNFGALARTKSRLEANGLFGDTLFAVADARKMPFKDSVFQAVTAWGGAVEIARAEGGLKETYRVLEENGWLGISGDQYKEDSPSMKVAESIGVASLVTRERLESALRLTGFRNLEYEVLFEGYDIDLDTPDEERCPLPARGDWHQIIAASGQK